MKIELPEPHKVQQYKFDQGVLVRGLPESFDWELIARLDRGEEMEIGNSQEEYEAAIGNRLRVQFGITHDPLDEEFEANMAGFHEAVVRHAQALTPVVMLDPGSIAEELKVFDGPLAYPSIEELKAGARISLAAQRDEEDRQRPKPALDWSQDAGQQEPLAEIVAPFEPWGQLAAKPMRFMERAYNTCSDLTCSCWMGGKCKQGSGRE